MERQAAPDGKIYMAIQGADYLAVIGAPNDTTRILSRLEYERVGVQLGRATSQLGLPNFVQNFTIKQFLGITDCGPLA